MPIMPLSKMRVLEPSLPHFPRFQNYLLLPSGRFAPVEALTQVDRLRVQVRSAFGPAKIELSSVPAEVAAGRFGQVVFEETYMLRIAIAGEKRAPDEELFRGPVLVVEWTHNLSGDVSDLSEELQRSLLTYRQHADKLLQFRGERQASLVDFMREDPLTATSRFEAYTTALTERGNRLERNFSIRASKTRSLLEADSHDRSESLIALAPTTLEDFASRLARKPVIDRMRVIVCDVLQRLYDTAYDDNVDYDPMTMPINGPEEGGRPEGDIEELEAGVEVEQPVSAGDDETEQPVAEAS